MDSTILVVDTNRILAALIRDGTTRKLLFSLKAQYIAPYHVWEEIDKYKEYAQQKSKLTESNYRQLLTAVQSKVKTIPKEYIVSMIP
jgi:predicted nucleic acid-binding protein